MFAASAESFIAEIIIRMGDSGSITTRIGSMKTLLGIVAGAGASYGIYKLLSGGSFRRYKKSGGNEGLASRTSEGKSRPGSLLAKVSQLDLVFSRNERTDDASGMYLNSDVRYSTNITNILH